MSRSGAGPGRHKLRRLAAVFLFSVAVATASLPRDARADHSYDPSLGIGLAVVAGVAEIFAITSGIVNGVSASKGKRPDIGWLVSGYILNSISFIGGTALLVDGLSKPGSEGSFYGVVFVGVGLAGLAIGGLGLGFTIWGHTKPQSSALILHLKPMASFGGRGEFIGGAALALTGF